MLIPYGVLFKVRVPLISQTTNDNITSAPTFEANDVQIFKNGVGPALRDSTVIAYKGRGFVEITLSDVDTSAKAIEVSIIDQTAPKVFKDQSILIETYGHADSAYPMIGLTSVNSNVVRVAGNTVNSVNDFKADVTPLATQSLLNTVSSNVVTISNKIGEPGGDDVVALIEEAIQGINDVVYKVGMPSGTLASDIAGVNSNVLNIQNNTHFSTSVSDVSVGAVDIRVPITALLRNSTGDLIDPFNSEISLQVRHDVPFVNSSSLYDTKASNVVSTVSTVYTPGFYKMHRKSTGVYEIWLNVNSSTPLGSATLSFSYKDDTEQVFFRSMNVSSSTSGAEGVELANSIGNKTLVASAMKELNAIGLTPITGSIYSDLYTNIQKIVSKLPESKLSDLSLLTTVEGVDFGTILSLIMAMVNGNYYIDEQEGTTTIMSRNGTTPATVIRSTKLTRTRIS